MNLRFALLLVSVMIGLSSHGQMFIEGLVTDQSGTPIPYVNIGIRGTTVGTSSFENGEFRISVPDSFKNDSLTFSAIGFKSTTRELNQLLEKESLSIVLEEDVVLLKEVVIKPTKKLKPIRIGLSGASNSAVAFSSPEGGAAMALLLNEERRTFTIETASVDISKSELAEFKLRCRIMEVENGKPGKDLLLESVIVSSTVEKGWVSVDLSSYNLVIDRPFFLVFEWILDKATSDFYKNIRENRPDWWPVGTGIENRNTVVYFDDQGNITKRYSMTKTQQDEYERIRKRDVEFSTKQSKFKCFARSSSMGEWSEVERDVVCYVIGY